MKTIVITGASSGIGLEAARILTRKGFNVLGIGHSEVNCDRAKDSILSENPDAKITYFLADLMQQREVIRIAEEITLYLNEKSNGELYTLINNAGCVRSWYMTTEEGYEQQFALNHLAGFLLTYKLLPALKKAHGRVIMTGSESHKGIKVYWDDVMLRRRYNPLTAYKQSKLCNILFAKGLNDRYAATGIRAYVVDPGLVNTDIGNKETGWLVNFIWMLRKRYGVPPEVPAKTYAFLCERKTAPDGLYYYLCKMNVMITGAAGGLGRVLANECGSRGYNLFLTDVNEDGLLRIKLGLERQFNVTVTTKACDLTNAESVDKMLAIIDKYGIRFDMLLNIAGLDFEGEFIGRDREKLVKIVMLNNAATLRITHAIIKRRRPDKHFTIVFVSSLASMFPMPLKATYAASKRFLLDFAISLRQELKKEDVNILTLCPGGMVTTQETMCSIKAQGFWGNATTNPLEDVARNTIDRALAGKSMYVPGKLNRILSFFGKIVPRSWVAAVVYWRWNNAQGKWLKHNNQSPNIT